MSENSKSDSPAFRLRPRAEPKSYYSIRLEYSANPAAFTRERPRSSDTKKRATATKSSYSKTRQQSNKLTAAAKSLLRHGYTHDALPPIKAEDLASKEDIEREERRKSIRRAASQSITTDTMISPFMQRLSISELKASTIYDQNYIRVKIESVAQLSRQDDCGAAVICQCSKINSDDESDNCDDEDTKLVTLVNVELYGDYAKTSLLKVGKILNIAKFKTGPETLRENYSSDSGQKIRRINFNVIVSNSVDMSLPTSTSSSSAEPTAPTATTSTRVAPETTLTPFVSITDMIDKPTDPYVEMAPPSPVPSLKMNQD